MTTSLISYPVCAAVGRLGYTLMQRKPLTTVCLVEGVNRVKQNMLQNNWKQVGVWSISTLAQVAAVVRVEDHVSRGWPYLDTAIVIGAKFKIFASFLDICGSIGQQFNSNATATAEDRREDYINHALAGLAGFAYGMSTG